MCCVNAARVVDGRRCCVARFMSLRAVTASLRQMDERYLWYRITTATPGLTPGNGGHGHGHDDAQR